MASNRIKELYDEGMHQPQRRSHYADTPNVFAQNACVWNVLIKKWFQGGYLIT